MSILGEYLPRSLVPAHQATTRNLGAAYPLVAEAGLGHKGVLIGKDLLGGSFVYDPFELYAQGVLSNPNMVVFGQIGRGKSSFIKTYLWRQAVFGRRAWVVDPKGEYKDLAAAWGVHPVTLKPGGNVRLNPLDPGPEPSGGFFSTLLETDDEEDCLGSVTYSSTLDSDRRQIGLLTSLAAACLGREPYPRERAAIDLALTTVVSSSKIATLPLIVDALLDPSSLAASTIRTDRRSLLEDGRDIALELRRLVHGDLRGMFDGPTTPGLDLSGPLVVLDLSALYNSSALGVLMTCATAWLQAELARSATQRGELRNQTVVVVDEAWAILANLGVARWLQSSWKLSRAYGVSNVAVLHRVSDLHSVGSLGSEQVGLAEGLLSDSETRVVYAQPPAEASSGTGLLSLSSTEAELLPKLRKGVALWKVGQRSFLVQHLIAPLEQAFIDTDSAMYSKATSTK